MRRLVSALAVAALIATGAGPVRSDDGIPIDMGAETECLGAVPHLPSVQNRKTITVDIVLALHGVNESFARRTLKQAAKPYARSAAPLPQLTPDVKFNIVAVHDLTKVLKGNVVTSGVYANYPTGTDLMSQLIRYYRTKYPKLKRDHVHLATNRNITADGVGDAVLGIANCIGSIGTKYSYTIAENRPDRPITIGVTFLTDEAAKVAAHEIGHAFGAHHHYAICGYRAVQAAQDREGDPCTTMFNSLDFLDLHFGPVEVASIRGYAEAHLR